MVEQKKRLFPGQRVVEPVAGYTPEQVDWANTYIGNLHRIARGSGFMPIVAQQTLKAMESLSDEELLQEAIKAMPNNPDAWINPAKSVHDK